MEIHKLNYFFFSPSSLREAFLGVGPKAAAKLLPRWILPSQTGQHWPSGWMVREQDRTGQMTGSQITVRFYVRGKKGNKDVREAADLNISCLSRFVVRTWQLQEKHLS